MPVKVGGVILQIATNVAKVVKDIDHIKSNLSKFSRDAKRLFRSVGISLGAAFSVYQIKKFIAEGVKTIDTLQDMSQSAAMASREFQGLLQSAKYAGVEQAGVATAIKVLNQNLYYARHGLGEYTRIFKDLNIDVHQPTSEVLYQLADRFQTMTDKTLRAGLASKALGRSGAQLIPVFLGGSKAIKETTERLEKMGAIISDETMRKMDILNRNFIDIQTAINGIKFQILSGMAEDLLKISKIITDNSDAFDMFERWGKIFGVIARETAATTIGILALLDVMGTAAGIMAGIGSGGKKSVFDVELLREGLAEVQKTMEVYGQILVNLRKKIELEEDDNEEVKIGLVFSEEQNKLIQKILNKQKSKIDLLNEEREKLRDIQIQIIAHKEEAEGLEETYHKIQLRVREIDRELKRLNTSTIWGNMKYGFEDYYESILDRNKQIQSAVISGMKRMEDAIVDFVVKGKLEWASLRDAILSDILRIYIRSRIIQPMLSPFMPKESSVTAGPVLGKGSRKRGRISSMADIVAENTYFMNRDIEDFVKRAKVQFDDMGKNLRKNLEIDRFDISRMPSGGGVGGGGGGGTTSGEAESGEGYIDVSKISSPIDAIMKAIEDATIENIAKALWETNFVAITTKWAMDVFESAIDSIFGKGTTDETIDKITDAIKSAQLVDLANVNYLATMWSADIMEAVIDSLFGKGTTDDLIDSITDRIKSIDFNSAILPSATNLGIGINFAIISSIFGPDATDKMIDGIKDVLSKLSENNNYLYTNLNTWSVSIMQASVDSIFGKDTVSDTIDKIKNNIEALPLDKVLLTAATNWAVGITTAVIDAIFGADVITDVSDAITDATKSVWDKFIDEIDRQVGAAVGTSGGGGLDAQDILFPFFNPFKTIKDLGGAVEDPKGTLEEIWDKLFHRGGIVGSGLDYYGMPRLHRGLMPDEYPAILQRGEMVIPKEEAARGGITINVPVNLAERNPSLTTALRVEIEKTVVNVMRNYA